MSENTKKILRQWQENFLVISNELKEAREIIKEWEDKTVKIHAPVDSSISGRVNKKNRNDSPSHSERKNIPKQ